MLFFQLTAHIPVIPQLIMAFFFSFLLYLLLSFLSNFSDPSNEETTKKSLDIVTTIANLKTVSAGKGSSNATSAVSASSKAMPSPVGAEPQTVRTEVKCGGPWDAFPSCKEKMEVHKIMIFLI